MENCFFATNFPLPNTVHSEEKGGHRCRLTKLSIAADATEGKNDAAREGGKNGVNLVLIRTGRCKSSTKTVVVQGQARESGEIKGRAFPRTFT